MNALRFGYSVSDVAFVGLVNSPAHTLVTYSTQTTLLDDRGKTSVRPAYDYLSNQVGAYIALCPASALIQRLIPNSISVMHIRLDAPRQIEKAYGSSQRNALLSLLAHGSVPLANAIPSDESQIDHFTIDGDAYSAAGLEQPFNGTPVLKRGQYAANFLVKPVSHITYDLLPEKQGALPQVTTALGTSVTITDLTSWFDAFEGVSIDTAVPGFSLWRHTYSNITTELHQHGMTVTYTLTALVISSGGTRYETEWECMIWRSFEPISGWAGRGASIEVGTSYSTTSMASQSQYIWQMTKNVVNGKMSPLHNSGEPRVSTSRGLTPFFPNARLTSTLPNLHSPVDNLITMSPNHHVSRPTSPLEAIQAVHKACINDSNRAVVYSTARAIKNIARQNELNDIALDIGETAIEAESTLQLLLSKPAVIEALQSQTSFAKSNYVYHGYSFADWLQLSAARRRELAYKRCLGVLGKNLRNPQWTSQLRRATTLARGVASSTLAVGFGLLPLINLVGSIPEFEDFVHQIRNIKAHSGVAYGTCDFNPNYGETLITERPSVRVRTKVRYSVDASSVFASLFPWAQLGIFNIGTFLWNITPLSWLVDMLDKSFSDRISASESYVSAAVFGVDYYTHSVTTKALAKASLLDAMKWRATSPIELQGYVRRVTTLVPHWDGMEPSGMESGGITPLGAVFGGSYAFLQLTK